MKRENIDKNKTLEQLEKSYWKDYDFETSLIRQCHENRKIPLKDLTVEHLRIMIGQNIGNEFLVPLALEELETNILAEGDFYEGDLLYCVLKSDREYWIKNKNQWENMINIYNRNIDTLRNFDIADSIKKEWFDLFEIFKNYIK